VLAQNLTQLDVNRKGPKTAQTLYGILIELHVPVKVTLAEARKPNEFKVLPFKCKSTPEQKLCRIQCFMGGQKAYPMWFEADMKTNPCVVKT